MSETTGVQSGVRYSEEDVAPHASWCLEHSFVFGCNGAVCYQPPDEPGTSKVNHAVLLTGLPRREAPNPVYEPEHAVLKLMPTRRLEERHDGLSPEDTHIVQVQVTAEGWNEDLWRGMTIPQARAVRDALTECIDMCVADAAELRRLGAIS